MSSRTLHKGLENGRWQTFSLATQLSNIGSEVGRLLRWRGVDSSHTAASMERAIELIDLSISDPRFLKRAGELLRLREVVADLGQEERVFDISSKSLHSYFAPFAMIHSASNNTKNNF